MIEIEEAVAKITERCKPIGIERRAVIDAVGCVAAEEIRSDVDSPPHDKSLVDGFAIRVDDAGKSLRLLEQVVAGEVPTKPIEPGTTSHIMTGAPVPKGTEAMVMVEDTTRTGKNIVMPDSVRPHQFVMPKAKTFAKGEVVLSAGTLIRPIEVGLLCEVGCSELNCYRRPTIAVLPTGDELVPITSVPSVGQIRNSNGPMLQARVAAAGCKVISLGVGRDDEAELGEKIEQGLNADIFVLSGGVSAGTRDLVPPMLESLGVERVFHKVRLKPGKPIWFGERNLDGRSTLVFGLPGNPVSSLVCFELFVQLAIRCISGLKPTIELTPIRLAESFTISGNRPTYYPAEMFRNEGRTFARPLPWQGSADMLTISRAHCFIYFGDGGRTYEAGEKLTALAL